VIEPADPLVARDLILEYATTLGIDLSFQNFQHEIDNLTDFYEAIFVKKVDGTPAGCVALRRIDAETCEMKRLYVRPQFRGRDLGRALAGHVIAEARRRGYARMRLDTLPTMTSAMELYRSLGFADIAPYRANPVEGSRFMELALR
jgi:ribosomal protein S18 acetylase RimI-like enzyme